MQPLERQPKPFGPLRSMIDASLKSLPTTDGDRFVVPRRAFEITGTPPDIIYGLFGGDPARKLAIHHDGHRGKLRIDAFNNRDDSSPITSVRFTLPPSDKNPLRISVLVPNGHGLDAPSCKRTALTPEIKDVLALLNATKKVAMQHAAAKP